jgi:uncharacterized protein (TIGR02996 family)
VDDAELVAAIDAAFDDDAPRLVYADRLMERGDPRGEYIHLACTRRDAPRETELLARHRDEWMRELPAWVDRRRCSFRRGFAHGIDLGYGHDKLFVRDVRLLAGILPRVEGLYRGGGGGDVLEEHYVFSPDRGRLLVAREFTPDSFAVFSTSYTFTVIDVATQATVIQAHRSSESKLDFQKGEFNRTGLESYAWRGDSAAVVFRNYDGTSETLVC